MSTPTSPRDFLRQIQQVQQDVDQLKQLIDSSIMAIGQQDPNRADAIQKLIQTTVRNVQLLRRDGSDIAQRIVGLSGLANTAALINSSLDPHEVLNGVVDVIVQLTGAERAYIVLLEGEELTPYAARNWDNETVPTTEMTFSRSIIRTTLKDAKPIVTTNAQLDERFENAESIAFKLVRAVLCVPLISRGSTIGVVYADNRLTPGIFNADTVELVSMFAHQAAIAIENARRFERVKQDLEDAQTQLLSLRIQIDSAARDNALKEITDTDYFKQLQGLVRQQRDRHKRQSE